MRAPQTANAGGIRVQTVSKGAVHYVRLYGTVDETFSSFVGPEATGQDVIVNLKEARRFTSFGVREWVRGWVRFRGVYG